MENCVTNWRLVPLRSFETIAAEWDRLNASGIPLLASDFVRLLRNYFATGDEQVLLGALADGRLAHACVLRKRNPFVVELWQPSQAPIALWVGAPLVKQERGPLLSWLSTVGLVFSITQVDSAFVPMPENDATLDVTRYIETARLRLSGTFESYWAGRGKNLRQNYRRQRNLFDREGVQTRLERLDKPEQVGEGVKSYATIESQGWKAASGTALQPDNAQGRFYCELIECFARAGEAMVYRYWYNDTLVAVDLCLQRAGIMYLLKTTYDESQKKTSPALHMRYSVLEEYYSTGSIQVIEFYGRVMEWHLRWTDDVRSLYHMTIYRFAPVKKLALGIRNLRSRKVPNEKPAEVQNESAVAASATAADGDRQQ